MKEVQAGPRGIIYGGDYNPEQWLDRPDILTRDLELMELARINTVTMGVFSWSFLEPSEGDYHLEWLRDMVDNLYRHGISVIMATPSGARPRWMAQKYPEVLRTNDHRIRNLYGGRHNHCYTSPIYREKVDAMDQRLARCFKDHPGVILWHISNEFGGECHCPLCQEAFRVWIRKKYGSLNRLNHAWWTAFWSHTYTSFDQVESPSPLGDGNLHGLNLDWKRFVTDQTADFLKAEVKAIRAGGAKQPVTTNFMQDYTGLNYAVLSRYVDVVSWDNYPSWHQKPDLEIAYGAALQHDYMRSLKNRPYLMMESSPGVLNWQGVSKLKRPGVLEAGSLQALAQGSDSIQFFQIRQSRGGSEKFHGAVIDHYGESDSRVFGEVADLGAKLQKLQPLCGTEVHAKAAIIYDMENRWALENAEGPRNIGLHYPETVMKVYRSLRRIGLNVDLIPADRSFQGYRILAAPMLYMFREGLADCLKNFVADGGILVMTCWSGVADESDLCFLGETPAGLTDVLGLRRKEIDALCEGRTCRLVPAKEKDPAWNREYTCENLCELVELKGARALLRYAEDFYAGTPALTVHTYGKGEAYYVCSDMDLTAWKKLCRQIAVKNDIPPLMENLPEEVFVYSRSEGNTEYVILQHFDENSVQVTLPEDIEILYGNPRGELKGYSTIIFSRKNNCRKLRDKEQ